MSDADTTTVTIQLLKREYNISCEPHERQELEEAARILDGHMRDTRDAQVVGLDRIAVMSALNIAHDLVKTQRQLTQQRNRNDRLSALSERVDREIREYNEYRNSLL